MNPVKPFDFRFDFYRFGFIFLELTDSNVPNLQMSRLNSVSTDLDPKDLLPGSFSWAHRSNFIV